MYLLFYGYKDTFGGARDFSGGYPSEDDAKTAGIRKVEEYGVRLSSWAHIAHLDGFDLHVVATLNIPGTEWAETGKLEWS